MPEITTQIPGTQSPQSAQRNRANKSGQNEANHAKNAADQQHVGLAQAIEAADHVSAGGQLLLLAGVTRSGHAARESNVGAQEGAECDGVDGDTAIYASRSSHAAHQGEHAGHDERGNGAHIRADDTAAKGCDQCQDIHTLFLTFIIRCGLMVKWTKNMLPQTVLFVNHAVNCTVSRAVPQPRETRVMGYESLVSASQL